MSVSQFVHYFVFFSHAVCIPQRQLCCCCYCCCCDCCHFWLVVVVATRLLCMRWGHLIHILAQIIKYLTATATTMAKATIMKVRAKWKDFRWRLPKESLIYAIIGKARKKIKWRAEKTIRLPCRRVFCNFHNFALFGQWTNTENVFAAALDAVKVTGDRNGQRRKRRVAVNASNNDASNICAHTYTCTEIILFVCIVDPQRRPLRTKVAKARVKEIKSTSAVLYS